MRHPSPPTPRRSGIGLTVLVRKRRGRATRAPAKRGLSPVTPCGREGCLEVARLGAAYCPLHEPPAA
jgi:hypothetical protein